jgi:hypothetical protein
MDLLLSALTWDPQIRGFVIVLVSFLILPGSVYLLLATNVGARIGFVLAAAGLFGWMAVMGIIWLIFGIGYIGALPEWKVEEVVTAESVNLGEYTTIEAARQFPTQWEKLKPGDAILGDAQAAADKVLAPSAGGGGHGEEAAAEPEETFDSPFSTPSDYVLVDAYRIGGERYGLFGLDFRPFNVFHKPHYAVVQVRPALRSATPSEPFGPGGAPGTPTADSTGAVTSVVLLRDLGDKRFPPFVIAVTSSIIFGVIVYWLHKRDQEIFRLRSIEAAPA